jgi:hypothetical protein
MSKRTKELIGLSISLGLTLLTIILRLRSPSTIPISPGVDLVD